MTGPSDDQVYDEVQQRSFAAASTATAESLDRRLSGPGVAAFVAARRYAAVATTRPDGRAHAAMTGFLATGGAVWLPVMRGTVRARNVRARPWASVVVAEGEGDEHTMVTLEGPAAVLDDLPDEARDAWAQRFGTTPDWASAWIRVEVQRLLSYAGPGSAFGPT